MLPKIVRYRGRSYRLVEAIMPAKAAEVKMKNLDRAVSRNPLARVVNADEWEIGEGGILNLVNKKDGGKPMLVIWNPVTSEMVISSDRNPDIFHHEVLFKKYRRKFKDYPLPHFRDWNRATLNAEGGGARLWKWEPLFEYAMYLSGRSEQAEMERIHNKGLDKFKQVLQDLGVTGPIGVIRT